MARFRDLFKRSKQEAAACQESPVCVPKASAAHIEHSATTINSTVIANLPIAGMQRSNQGTYMTTYSSVSAQASSGRSPSDVSTDTDSSRTAVESGPVPQHSGSVWKGKPLGRPYDKREELTAEDEDMWANLAM